MAANVEGLGTLERRVSMSVPVRDIAKKVLERLKPLARNEVLGDAVQKSFSDAVKEANLRVAGYPKIEKKDEAGADALEFSATFEIYPEVKPGELSGATIEQPKEGDRLTVDFNGTIDGVP